MYKNIIEIMIFFVHIVQKELTIEEATDSCDYINLRNYVHLLKKKKRLQKM